MSHTVSFLLTPHSLIFPSPSCGLIFITKATALNPSIITWPWMTSLMTCWLNDLSQWARNSLMMTFGWVNFTWPCITSLMFLPKVHFRISFFGRSLDHCWPHCKKKDLSDVIVVIFLCVCLCYICMCVAVFIIFSVVVAIIIITITAIIIITSLIIITV